jgi:hypothetical protein
MGERKRRGQVALPSALVRLDYFFFFFAAFFVAK